MSTLKRAEAREFLRPVDHSLYPRIVGVGLIRDRKDHTPVTRRAARNRVWYRAKMGPSPRNGPDIQCRARLKNSLGKIMKPGNI